MKKRSSKVAHNRPRPFLPTVQPSPGHSPQPKIDSPYHGISRPDLCITFAFNFDPNQEKSFCSTQIELCFGRKKGKCVNTKRGSRYLGAYIYVYILLSCLLWYCTANTSYSKYFLHTVWNLLQLKHQKNNPRILFVIIWYFVCLHVSIHSLKSI